MSDRPLVSVVMPAFNAERFIGDAIQSVLAQTYHRLEVIVADDGSSDGTEARVRAFRSAAVQWLPSDVPSGRPAVPRNRALVAATGEFVAFLDADDLWSRDKLADQVGAFLRHPELVLVYSVVRAIGPGARFTGTHYGLKPWPTRAAVDARTLEAANTIPCSSVLVRRSVVRDLGGFDEDPGLSAVEDFDLWLKVSRLGPIGFIPRVHGYYRVHDSGLSRDADIQRARAEYLVHKRKLTRFTFREFRVRPMPLRLARNVLDLAMTAKLSLQDRRDRLTGGPVPIVLAS